MFWLTEEESKWFDEYYENCRNMLLFGKEYNTDTSTHHPQFEGDDIVRTYRK